ncbi:hypothetical protein MD26_04415 [Pseudomonas sp. H2]|nr:hypothetical protein MD26_04415 [Pseudomonas sp. H2]
MLDDLYLRWEDYELLADFFANGLLATVPHPRQVTLRQLINDHDTEILASVARAVRALGK